jgi:hypothetical protein
VVIEQRGPVDVEILVADDGTRQLTRVIDHKRGADCGASPPSIPDDDPAREARCLPSSTVAESGYSDPGCTMSGASTQATCSAANLAIATRGTCRSLVYQVWTLGDPATTAYEMPHAGACSPVPVSGNQLFRPFLAPVDPTSFPALRVSKIGGGRLVAPILTGSGDSRPVGPYRNPCFWDSERAGYCCPFAFSDGAMRCLSDGTVGTYESIDGYADAACTQRLAQADDCTDARFATENDDSGGIIRVYVFKSVRPVIGAFIGDTRYTKSNGACVATPVDSTRYLVLGEPIDPDTAFPKLKIETE